MFRSLRIACGVLIVAAGVSFARADQVKLNNGLPYPGTVTDYRNFEVMLTLPNSQIARHAISQIATITIDGKDDFNAAEAALAKKDYDGAIRLYDKAQRGQGDWIKALIADRRFMAASRAGKIDQAVKHWLTLAEKAGLSKVVVSLTPQTYAEAGASANKRAVDLLSQKAQRLEGRDKEAYLRAVLELKMAIQRADNDTQGAAATAQQIQQIGQGSAPGSTPASPGTRRTPARRVPVGEASLQAMRAMLENGQAAQVVEQITASLKKYDTPELPEALTLLGRAELAAFEAGGAKEAKLLISAGKHLVLVFAEFSGSAQAPEALYYAAKVNEQLGEKAAVQATLAEIIKRYPDSEWAQKAQTQLGG